MTHAQVKALTDEKIRIKVAELLGAEWYVDFASIVLLAGKDYKESPCTFRQVLVFCPDGNGYQDGERVGLYYAGHDCKHPKDGCGRNVPNYPQDLNACHEMEKVFGCELGVYEHNLKQVCGYGYMCGAMATARQRCEAFIITMEEV